MYFDLHLHPSFKPFLTSSDKDKKDHCWVKPYNNAVNIIDSQSSLVQIKNGKVSVGVAAVYVMEKQMTSSFLISRVLPAISMMDEKFINTIASKDSFMLLLEEIEHLESSQNFSPSEGKEFRIINSFDQIEKDKINLILAIEGGHCLASSISGTYEEHLLFLKKYKYRFLYLTFTHMTRSHLCTHAYGMKLIKNNIDFRPGGFGLSDTGKRLIDLAYDEKNGDRILIDVKHMSLVSRRQFYKYRLDKRLNHIPIIASHMGVTGISWDSAAIQQFFIGDAIYNDDTVQIKYQKPLGYEFKSFFGKQRTSFNPWSINLYDEELEIIVESGGVIGVSLDQRIIGSDKITGEYFSLEEFNSYFDFNIINDDSKLEDELFAEYEEALMSTSSPFVEVMANNSGAYSSGINFEMEEFIRFNKKKHLAHLVNTILHIVKVVGEKAWGHICIGSDFDGLINPINGCKSVEEFTVLEKDLVVLTGEMIESIPQLTYTPEEIEVKVRMIMYENALKFLETNLK